MKDLDQLQAELRWAIDSNEDRPRTEAALRWALETFEAMARPIVMCDGCQVGAPINEWGIHRYSDGSPIGCTRDRYVEREEVKL